MTTPTPAAPATTPADTRSVAGWALRAALGVAALATVLAVVIPASHFDAIGMLTFFLVVAAIGTSLAPGSLVPAGLLLAVVALRLAATGPAIDGVVATLVALIPLVHQLAGICATVPPRSSCRWAALRPAALRYLAAVVPTEVAVVVVIAVSQ